MIRQPISVYNNWSAYDELSDNVALTEELALKQLDEMLRLREAGVRMDYYLMDAFWFAEDGGYRTWRKPHFPDGPDNWLAGCLEHGIKPGLWVSTNTLTKLICIDEWESSVNAQRSGMCLFTGGYLSHFMETLQRYYDRGVRMYKFDFADFWAHTPEVSRTMRHEEMAALNVATLKNALRVFRQKNPEVVLLAYNGFGGELSGTSLPMLKTVDADWLTVFDSLYCGDPRPSDVPCMNFWRSKDIYSDHMVRYYESNDIPLERIDNCAFMIGTTGTCYNRGTEAWKAMLLLSLARGGWVNVFYGNLDLLDAPKAEWFARAQSVFMPLLAHGRTCTFGGVPGEATPYGYASTSPRGSAYTVVNPSQTVAEVNLPVLSDWQAPLAGGRVLFSDAGFEPELGDSFITLGPEQVALVGFGDYASEDYDLGVQDDVVIPRQIAGVPATFEATTSNSVSAVITAPAEGSLRIVMRQLNSDGTARRSTGGAPPSGVSMGNILCIGARQGDRDLPIRINYDKAIWSGLSWAVAEIDAADMEAGGQIAISCSTSEIPGVDLDCRVYAVD